MNPTITETDATLGAVVTDIELRSLDREAWRAVEAAFHERAVLIFPGQHLTPAEQTTFAQRFGEIEILTPNRKMTAVSISNVKLDGTTLAPDEDSTQILRGNEGWHTDSSYLPLSAKASVLSARVVPTDGGETEWADMRAAYDALEESTRSRIAKLSAHHSLYYSQAKIGHKPKTNDLTGFRTEGAPLRPLVKCHPVTKRNALFIGRHAYAIPGLSESESERLLEELTEFACRAPRVHRHRWEPGDVAIWDNRAVLHRARPYDYGKPRSLVHVRIAGDPRSELAQTDSAFR